MTMLEFMQNAFFLLCGIACIAAAFLIIYITLIAAIHTFKGVKSNGRKRD